jgi:hypothetical protein
MRPLDYGYDDLLTPTSSAGQRRLVEVLGHICTHGNPSSSVDAFVSRLTDRPEIAHPVTPLRGRRVPVWRFSLFAAVLTAVIVTTIIINSVAQSPAPVSAGTVLVRAARAATPKPGQVLERVYSERVKCHGLSTCRNLTFRVWSMRIDGTYVVRGTETVTRTGKVVYFFRLAHNMGSPMNTAVNFALVWQRPRLRSNRGELIAYFIHGIDDPGVAAGLAATARSDGFISTGDGTGYRLVHPRLIEHVAAYDLRFVQPRTSYDVYYAVDGYALLGMRGHGWSASLRQQKPVSLCSSPRYLFTYFWRRNPSPRHCRE